MADTSDDESSSFAVGAAVISVLVVVCVSGVAAGCYCACRRARAKAEKVVSRCSLPEVSAPNSPTGSRQTSRTSFPLVTSPNSPGNNGGRLYVSSARRISSGNLPYTSTSNKSLPAIRSPHSPASLSPSAVRERAVGDDRRMEMENAPFNV